MTIRLSHKPADASPAVLPQVAGPERVSILIRTLGRPTLSQAVLSALTQTWPCVSVKLVRGPCRTPQAKTQRQGCAAGAGGRLTSRRPEAR